MQKQQLGYFNNGLTQKLQQKPKNVSIPSQYFQEYQQKMANIELNDDQLIKLLQKHRIKYNTKKKISQFRYYLKQNKFNYEALVLKIQIGYFQLQVSILNKQSSSPFKRACKNTKSMYGIIYFLETQQTQIAIKTISYLPNDDQDQLQLFSKKFLLVLKQWTITRIASALNCAPQMHKPFGFDIVVYNDQISFAMESCAPQYTLTRTDFCELKRQLAILHRFNIIHMDIKPTNLMFSKSLKKMVFIDFGISQLIFVSKGQKSLSKFNGTPNFVYQQMLNLICEKSKSYIDLYYNDLYGLITCKKMFQNNFQYHQPYQQEFQQKERKNLSEQQRQTIKQCLDNIKQQLQFQKFKYYYIKNDIINLKQLLKQNYLNLKQKKIKKILQFTKDNYNVDFLKQLLQQLLDFKDNQQYKEIYMKYITCNEFLFKNIKPHIFQQNQELQELYKNNFKIKYDQIFIESMKQNRLQDYNQLYNKLLDQQYTNNLDKQILFAYIHKCLRFDNKNLQINQKIKLCLQLKKMDGQDLKEDYKGTFEDVKDIFKKLLKYYLSQPFTDDKKKLCLQTFYNNILIDNDVLKELYQFQQKFKKQYVGIQQRLILAVQFRLIQQLLSCAVITETNKHYKLQTMNFIKLKVQIFFTELYNIQFCKNPYQQNLKLLLKLINKKFYLDDKDIIQNFQTINDLIQKIKNKKVKFTLQIFMIDLILQLEKGILSNKIAVKIKKFFRQNNHNDGFPIYFAISYKFLYMQGILDDELSYLIQSIKNNINYDPVYFLLNFELCHDYSNYDVNDQSSLAHYLNKIVLNINIQGNYNDLIRSFRFQWIFHRIKKYLKVKLSQEVTSILLNIIFLIKQINLFQINKGYLQSNQNRTQLKKFNRKLSNIINIFQFQNSILQLIPEDFLKQQKTIKACLQQKYEEFKKSQSYNSSDQHYNLLQNYICKLNIIYYYRLENNLNKIKQLTIANSLLQDLNKCIDMTLLPYYTILTLAMILSIQIGDQQMYSQLIGRLFRQTIVNKNIFDFFCQKNFILPSNNIYNMIDYYYRANQKDKTQQILRVFFEWLSNNHLQSYGKVIILSLKHIQKLHKNIYRDNIFSEKIMSNKKNDSSYFILYYIFIIPYQDIVKVKQKILLKIALRLQQVIRIVKKYILNSYYHQFFKLKLFPKRKVRHLLCKQAKHYVANKLRDKNYQSIIKKIEKKMKKEKNYIFCKSLIDKLKKIAKINLFEVIVGQK